PPFQKIETLKTFQSSFFLLTNFHHLHLHPVSSLLAGHTTFHNFLSFPFSIETPPHMPPSCWPFPWNLASTTWFSSELRDHQIEGFPA
ncbi:hypothetical protein VIGAN_08249400, partial [Vigna angularis var. angularis]